MTAASPVSSKCEKVFTTSADENVVNNFCRTMEYKKLTESDEMFLVKRY